jgi:hypothetical protein
MKREAPCPIPNYTRKGFHEAILRFVVENNTPFSQIESPSFRYLCRYLRPNCDLFGRTALTNFLKEHAVSVRAQLLNDLPPKRKISIAIDCWTSMNCHGFMSVTGYYITDRWEYREVMLAFRVLTGRHSGKTLAEITTSILRQYKIQHQLLAVTADNAANNDTLRKELALKLQNDGIQWDSETGSVHCLSHVIQLAVQALLKSLRCNAQNEETERRISNKQLRDVGVSIKGVFQKVCCNFLLSFFSL